MITGHKITFDPLGRSKTFTEHISLLNCAGHLGISLVTVCGGSGTCGKCIVKILDGPVSPITDMEKKHIDPDQLALGYRLACCTFPTGNCRVYIPMDTLSTLSRAQVEGFDITVEPDPADNIIGLLSVNGMPLGLAIDLGTTKIAGYLVNLSNGTVLGAKGILNPQTVFGDDVISRLVAATRSPDDKVILQQLMVNAINNLIHDLCTEIDADATLVVDIIVVANTAIHHLLLGLPVKQLCIAPYAPAKTSALKIKARDIGLKAAAGAYLRLLPNIAGFVGGDHVAMILATDIHKKNHPVLALDIGTNTEICLVKNNKIYCLSCASGPAFEGAHITSGMRVAEGAIEHVGIAENRVTYQTVGDRPAIGICGSGIIDVTAVLLHSEIIDISGKMSQLPGVRKEQGQLEFVIASNKKGLRNVTFTQKDVREVQLAKGAINAGIRVLLDTGGIDMESINEVIIAGAFGTYIDIQSAIDIGMLPDLPLDRFRQVGNAAGMGAKMALISQQKWQEAETIAERIEYIELASYPGFNKIFAKAMSLEKQK